MKIEISQNTNDYIDLNLIHSIQKDIFVQFISLCHKYKLKYFIIGGTLLGAVRHQGFIPWDDDIDVAMPRPDFERFNEIATQELSVPYFLQTHKTDPEYFMHIARLHNIDTTCIEESFKHLNICFGICIDIYPLDGFINTPSYIKYFINKRKTFERCITEWIDGRKCYKKYIKNIIGKTINYLRFNNKDRNYFFNEIDKLYKNIPYDNAYGYVANLHDLEIHYASIFQKPRKYKFEDLEVYGPQDYHQYLTQLYGKYQELPPLDRRKPHHGHVILDPNVPYLHYISKPI